MKTLWIAAVLFLASLSLRGQSPFFTVPTPKGVLRVALVPTENATASDVEVVKKALENYYGVHVTVTPPLTLAGRVGTNGRSHSVRNQAGTRRVVTDSTLLRGIPFNLFTEHAGKEFDKVVGLSGYGINTGEGQWTTRGLTNHVMGCSLVTTYLVRQQSATVEEYQSRLAKVALHEFGHALGLPHCGDAHAAGEPQGGYSDRVRTVTKGDPRCFMLQSMPDGRQWYATTDQLCKQCHARIKDNAKPVSFLRTSHP
ncbi:MAG TPA: hypothetical protein VF646_08040 [Cytophagales bacterium]|jgi:hypothetical protein